MLTPEDLAQITAIVTAAEERLNTRIDQSVEAIATATRAEVKAAKDEAVENIETNLLTSFHVHAKGQTARLHTVETVAHDYGIRLAAIEERLLNLETRRPPQ